MGQKAAEAILDMSGYHSIPDTLGHNPLPHALARFGNLFAPAVIDWFKGDRYDIARCMEGWKDSKVDQCRLNVASKAFALIGVRAFSQFIELSIKQARHSQVGDWYDESEQKEYLQFAATFLRHMQSDNYTIIADALVERVVFLARELGNHKTIAFLKEIGLVSTNALIQMAYDKHICRNEDVGKVVREKIRGTLSSLEASGPEVGLFYLEAGEDGCGAFHCLSKEDQQNAKKLYEIKYAAVFAELKATFRN